MAKPKIPNQRNRYAKLRGRLNKYALAVQDIYDTLNKEAARIAASTDFAGNGVFRFSDYPMTADAVNRLQGRFVREMRGLIYAGTSAEWKESNLVQDLLASKVLKTYGAQVSGQKTKVYYQSNSDALKAFQKRTEKGMNLSEKLWNQSGNYKQELEYAISSAVEKGTSAVTLSKRLSKYLNDFPSLKADYKEKFGQAVTCHDCEYRSIRLARTEINMAYRTAEQTRWKQMDFVVGYEIKTSYSHEEKDICDSAQGKYPKDFVFVGWHPNCMCYVIPILKTEDEFWADDQLAPSVNEVTDVPEGMKTWVAENQGRIAEAEAHGALPYWYADNRKYVQGVEDFNVCEIKNRAKDGTPFSAITKEDLEEFSQVVSDAYKKAGVELFEDEKVEIYIDRRGEGLYINDKRNLEFDIQFDAETKAMKIDLFIIDNEEMRGLGLSKSMFDALLPTYDKLGVEKIIVHAGDKNGGYTWARYGFRAKYREASSAINLIEDKTLQQKAESIFEKFYETHEKSELFPMNMIAEKEWGRKALSGTKWWGEIDMLDATQRKNYVDYIRGTKVTEVTDKFGNWIDKNYQRILNDKKRGTLPKWFMDNPDAMDCVNLIGKAREVGDIVQAKAVAIAEECNGVVTPINYKGFKSMFRKLRDPNDPKTISDIKDAVRNTIVVEKKDIDKVVSKLKELDEFWRYKKQTPDKFFGYSGNIINLSMPNGIKAEIQVNTPKMIFAKEKEADARRILGDKVWEDIAKKTGMKGGLGHEYYEQIRLLDNVKDAEKIAKLAKKMEEYYSHFR